MEVWKIIFLSKWVIGRFHVNLPGCKKLRWSKKMKSLELHQISQKWGGASWGFLVANPGEMWRDGNLERKELVVLPKKDALLTQRLETWCSGKKSGKIEILMSFFKFPGIRFRFFQWYRDNSMVVDGKLLGLHTLPLLVVPENVSTWWLEEIQLSLVTLQGNTLPETNIAPENRPSQ